MGSASINYAVIALPSTSIPQLLSCSSRHVATPSDGRILADGWHHSNSDQPFCT